MLRTIYLIAISTFAFSQTAEITNITASQRTDGSRLVDVCYDLQGDENFSIFSISAEISFDGGSSYQAVTNAVGDIGGDIEEGAGKCFVWDFGSEVGELYTAQAVFRITADSAPMAGSCVDYDGNEYETVEIGDQLWMAENLKTTHYNNGDEITHITDNNAWGSYDEGQYGVYDNNSSNADIYGNLYNWAVVDDSRGVCPENYHVPTDDEYKVLEMYLGMSESEANDTGWRGTNEGSKLAGNADLWNNGNLENNSEFGTSGFNALPAGYRSSNLGSCLSMGTNGYFWSSSESSSYYAWNRKLYSNNSDVFRNYYGKQYGFSVRCVGD